MTAPAVAQFSKRYTEGFAQLLANLTTGWSWQSNGVYPAGQVGQYVAAVPTSPDKIVTLTPIVTAKHPTLSSADVDLQIRCRSGADIRDTWAMLDAAAYYFSGRFPLLLPTGVWVSTLTYGYRANLGQDTSKRWEVTDLWHTSAADPRR